MRSIEMLIVTMNQKGVELYFSLGLKTKAVIANQTDNYCYEEFNIDGNIVKLVSTNDQGVGKNRNMALLNASADICVLGDDDLDYHPDYPKIISEAFDNLPDADIIVFDIMNLQNPNNRITNIKRVGLLNFARYGAVRIGFKRESILKANIWFSLLYGGGAKYSSGEDTLFLREALKKGLRIYTYPKKIADAKQDCSTWFTGYNAKFFFDKGILLANLFPVLKHLMGIYFAIRFRTTSQFSLRQSINYIFNGIKGFKGGISYDQWKEKTSDS